jgi:DNA polymerase-4
LEHYSPNVRALSIDEGLVDLTGTDRLFGPPLKTADTIIRRIENDLALPSSGGLSTSRVTAKIAATLAKPRGLVYVPAGFEIDFLAPLAVGMIPGVGPKTHKSFGQKGIKTIGDLLSRKDLAARHLDLAELAAQRHHHHDHSVGNETTLERPVKDIAAMERILWELIEEVGGRLRREELYARCLTVKIRYTNFHTITRSRTLSAPTCFDKEIFAVVSDLLGQNVGQGRAVRLLGVSASALQSTGWQEPLLDRDRRKSLEQLYKGIDELRRKYGEATVGAASPRHKPD